MQREQLKILRSLLLKKRMGLLSKATEFRTQSEFEALSKGDEVEIAASEMNLSLSLRLQERDQFLLQKINRALSKFSLKTYGVCESCKGEIGFKRLMIRPVANLCIECKEEQENQERILA